MGKAVRGKNQHFSVHRDGKLKRRASRLSLSVRGPYVG